MSPYSTGDSTIFKINKDLSRQIKQCVYYSGAIKIKPTKYMKLHELKTAIKRGFNLSNRGTSWVAAQLYTEQLDCSTIRESREYVGSGVSEETTKALKASRDLTAEQLEIWVQKACEVKQAEDELFAAQQAVEVAKKKLNEWVVGGRLTTKEAEGKAAIEGNVWWENEGKYEHELEVTGRSKEWYYDSEKRMSEGRQPLNACDFCKNL